MFVHRIRVRYSECDQQGVMFVGHYMFYYDVALTELWRAHVCRYQDMVEKGDDMMVAESRLRYVRSARFDDNVDIEIPIHHLGTTSVITRPVFRVDGQVITEGEVRHVFIDPSANSKKPIPDYVRTALSTME
ncbi:acyl-CoA thioesterase [Kibdelosporangium philippinense]|uniref:Acyl-CoA thioesterase n=1 Tax=Kibdelosporangium philippinense TaxID=211113 RepID=A0ABS8ZJ97_9PSEU|nr:thioesterase family protein [Kibdelosporangium philippinense]MCE7007494.1 acyl-CoA thioesterase [Kibdelosporangium philippinense]